MPCQRFPTGWDFNLLTELIPSVLIVTVLVLMNWSPAFYGFQKIKWLMLDFFFLVGLSEHYRWCLQWYKSDGTWFLHFCYCFGILVAPFVVPFVKNIKHMQLMVLIKIASIVSVISVLFHRDASSEKWAGEKEIISDVHSIGKSAKIFYGDGFWIVCMTNIISFSVDFPSEVLQHLIGSVSRTSIFTHV